MLTSFLCDGVVEFPSQCLLSEQIASPLREASFRVRGDGRGVEFERGRGRGPLVELSYRKIGYCIEVDNLLL